MQEMQIAPDITLAGSFDHHFRAAARNGTFRDDYSCGLYGESKDDIVYSCGAIWG